MQKCRYLSGQISVMVTLMLAITVATPDTYGILVEQDVDKDDIYTSADDRSPKNVFYGSVPKSRNRYINCLL